MFGATNKPKRQLDKEIVILPEQHMVSETVVHVRCVEQASAAAIDRYVESTAVEFVSQNGQDDGVGDSLKDHVKP
jgi:hypothetical protein